MGRNGQGRQSAGGGSTKIKNYTAPTPGLENVYFGLGNAFKDVVRELAGHVEGMDQRGAKEAAYALNSNIRPEHVTPEMVDESCPDYSKKKLELWRAYLRQFHVTCQVDGERRYYQDTACVRQIARRQRS